MSWPHSEPDHGGARQGLDFSLKVFHPYNPLFGYVNGLEYVSASGLDPPFAALAGMPARGR